MYAVKALTPYAPSPAQQKYQLRGLFTFLSFVSVKLWGAVCFSGADAFGIC